MTQLPSFHDYEIIEILADKISSKIALGLRSPDLSHETLCFHGVPFWDLGPFDTQNVIFDVVIHPPSAIDDFADELPASLHEQLSTGRLKLFEVDSSVGMSGFVVAQSAEIIRTDSDQRSSSPLASDA